MLDIIKNPRVQQLAAQKASAFFGRPMQAQFALAGQTDASGKDPMDALIARGKANAPRYYDDQIKGEFDMAKGGYRGGMPMGGMNQMQMMKQAQKMQQDLRRCSRRWKKSSMRRRQAAA